jgi:hypothetical protein
MFVIKAKATDAMWKRTWTRDSANKDCWTLTLLLLHFQSITKSHTAVLIHKSSSELRSDHTSTGQTIFGHVPRDWTRESFAHAPQSCQQTASIILNRPLLPHHIANFFFTKPATLSHRNAHDISTKPRTSHGGTTRSHLRGSRPGPHRPLLPILQDSGEGHRTSTKRAQGSSSRRKASRSKASRQKATCSTFSREIVTLQAAEQDPS